MRREVLGDLPGGTIVRVGQSWGVICVTRGHDPRRWRIVDFWHTGRERVRAETVVRVLQ